jgi:phosphoglycerol transferase
MIFQLPYLPYPEAGFVGHVEDYDPFRGYIHSTDLRWSYGAMRNRPQDKIDKDLAALPPVDMVPKLRALGFAGIWLDLYGYDLAQWPALVSAYSSATNDSTPLYSDDADHRFFFFKIAP